MASERDAAVLCAAAATDFDDIWVMAPETTNCVAEVVMLATVAEKTGAIRGVDEMLMRVGEGTEAAKVVEKLANIVDV